MFRLVRQALASVIPVGNLRYIALLTCAVCLSISFPRPRAAPAGETGEVRGSSQSGNADAIAPALRAQPATVPYQSVPYQMDQDTGGPEPQGAQEYMDANEQISLHGIEMRVDTRKAERE